MKARTLERINRASQLDIGTSNKFRIVAINAAEGSDPTVDIIALEKTRVYDVDQPVQFVEPLEIKQVPYGGLFKGTETALWIAPAVGMEGWFVQSDFEVGEISGGQTLVERIKDKSSGWFMPSGSIENGGFQGSTEWSEFRGADGTRVAISRDAVHLEAGGTSIIIRDGQWDIVSGGVSLVEALQEMSKHIKDIEAKVHDGFLIGPVQQRTVDQFTKATSPERTESGV